MVAGGSDSALQINDYLWTAFHRYSRSAICHVGYDSEASIGEQCDHIALTGEIQLPPERNAITSVHPGSRAVELVRPRDFTAKSVQTLCQGDFRYCLLQKQGARQAFRGFSNAIGSVEHPFDAAKDWTRP